MKNMQNKWKLDGFSHQSGGLIVASQSGNWFATGFVVDTSIVTWV